MPAYPKNPAALPVYIQVSELLIREIAAGRLVDGERLPPERQLAKQHGVSVQTLRKSLKELEKKNLLTRVQGSGNYVQATAHVQSIYSMFRLELIDGGGLPTAEFLSIELCDKPADLPAFGTSLKGTRFRRLRKLNGRPAAVEEIWLDADAGIIDPEQVSDSLYRTYQTKLGFWISRATDMVSIGPVPDWSPPEFALPAGALTGFIERFSWSQATAPVEYSRTWFDTNIAHYVQRLM